MSYHYKSFFLYFNRFTGFIDSFFNKLSRLRIPPLFWIFLLWFLIVIPSIFIKGSHFEEKTTINIARNAFEGGHWLTQFRYGVRFVERPTLVSWLLGGIGYLLDSLPLWIARLPMVFAYLLGAILVYRLVKQYANLRAAMFGSICFLICPMMLQKTVTAEVDGVVSVMLFAGFVIWWNIHTQNNHNILKWLCLTIILSAASLIKGPQPLGFFFLGIGFYLLIRRNWKELLLLFFVGVITGAILGSWYLYVYQPSDLRWWLNQSRVVSPRSILDYINNSCNFIIQLLIEWLPGLLLAIPLIISLFRRKLSKNYNNLTLALFLYAGICSAILSFWPYARTRYAMPSTLAIASLAGLAYDKLLFEKKIIINLSQTLMVGLIIYAVTLNLFIIPIITSFSPPGQRSYSDIIELIIAQKPETLYVTPKAIDGDVMIYLQNKTHTISFDKLKKLKPPFYAILTSEQAKIYKAQTNNKSFIVHFPLKNTKGNGVFVEVSSKTL